MDDWDLRSLHPKEDETFTVQLTLKESVLIDHVLTLHQWDREFLGQLMTEFRLIREANARVLCGGTDKIVFACERTTDEVIAMIPPIFVIGGEEVGFSLKTKMYNGRYNLKEKEDANRDTNKNDT